MKKRAPFGFILVFFVALFTHQSLAAQEKAPGFDRNALYAALAGKSQQPVDEQLTLLQKNPGSDKAAFEGALLMRKAGMVAGAGKKLKLFKEGREKLETAIAGSPDNGEYRFLRLLIQENAPGIVNYKSDIAKDKEIVRQAYKKLSPAVQAAILKYSQTSKVLRQEELK